MMLETHSNIKKGLRFMKIESVAEQIREKIWNTETPSFVKDCKVFRKKEIEEFLFYQSLSYVAASYIDNLLNSSSVSQKEIEELIEKAKTKQGLEQVAISAIMNIKLPQKPVLKLVK